MATRSHRFAPDRAKRRRHGRSALKPHQLPRDPSQVSRQIFSGFSWGVVPKRDRHDHCARRPCQLLASKSSPSLRSFSLQEAGMPSRNGRMRDGRAPKGQMRAFRHEWPTPGGRQREVLSCTWIRGTCRNHTARCICLRGCPAAGSVPAVAPFAKALDGSPRALPSFRSTSVAAADGKAALHEATSVHS